MGILQRYTEETERTYIRAVRSNKKGKQAYKRYGKLIIKETIDVKRKKPDNTVFP